MRGLLFSVLEDNPTPAHQCLAVICYNMDVEIYTALLEFSLLSCVLFGESRFDDRIDVWVCWVCVSRGGAHPGLWCVSVCVCVCFFVCQNVPVKSE